MTFDQRGKGRLPDAPQQAYALWKIQHELMLIKLHQYKESLFLKGN